MINIVGILAALRKDALGWWFLLGHSLEAVFKQDSLYLCASQRERTVAGSTLWSNAPDGLIYTWQHPEASGDACVLFQVPTISTTKLLQHTTTLASSSMSNNFLSVLNLYRRSVSNTKALEKELTHIESNPFKKMKNELKLPPLTIFISIIHQNERNCS